MSVIISPKTAAETQQRAFAKGSLPKSIIVMGDLDGVEAIAVNVVDSAGNTNVLYDVDGVAVTLVATSQPLGIDFPIVLQFVKPETANAVGLEMVD